LARIAHKPRKRRGNIVSHQVAADVKNRRPRTFRHKVHMIDRKANRKQNSKANDADDKTIVNLPQNFADAAVRHLRYPAEYTLKKSHLVNRQQTSLKKTQSRFVRFGA
jgi:hypothetical protein